MESSKITQLLQAQADGDKDVYEVLIPLVYEKLKRIAHKRMLAEQGGHTLNTTDVVHEAYLKLIDYDQINWQNRSHFYAIASQVMRNILVDYAKKKKAEKRGGGRNRVTLRDADASTNVDLDQLLSIHQALERLSEFDERRAKVVECRFFGGLNMKEIGETLGISTRTVHRDMDIASAWLNRELKS
jgi:RNA polymerase sigma factor (TIGR02999 family)